MGVVVADYSKRERRKAEMRRFIASERPPQPLARICWCREQEAAIEVNRPPRQNFYCAGRIIEVEAKMTPAAT